MPTEVTINKKLNLVIPIEIDSGKIWIHSIPLSRAVFETNYMLLTRTLSYMYANGVGPAMAPRIAALALKDVAKEIDENQDVSNNLTQEIYRLTNVLMPNPSGVGWQTIPYIEVKSKKLIDEDTLAEVENAIIYFMVASAIHRKGELPMAYNGLKGIWSAQTTSLNVTEYGNSLTTSTKAENIGERLLQTPRVVVSRASSIPS